MKSIITILTVVSLCFVGAGCSQKPETNKTGWETLASGFGSAEPAIKANIDKAVVALQAADYPTAGTLLENLLMDKKLSNEQRNIVSNVINQLPPYLRAAP